MVNILEILDGVTDMIWYLISGLVGLAVGLLYNRLGHIEYHLQQCQKCAWMKLRCDDDEEEEEVYADEDDLD